MEGLKRASESESISSNLDRPAKVPFIEKGPGTDPDTRGPLDVELFQKEAIWRQLNDGRRRTRLLEEELEDLRSQKDKADLYCTSLESWWDELINQLNTSFSRFEEKIRTADEDVNHSSVSRALFISGEDELAEHLQKKKHEIAAQLKRISGIIDTVVPEEFRKELINSQLLDTSAQLTALKDKLKLLAKEKLDIESRLEKTRSDYLDITRRIDRKNSKTLRDISRVANGTASPEDEDQPVETVAEEKYQITEEEKLERVEALEREKAGLQSLVEQLRKESTAFRNSEEQLSKEILQLRNRLESLSEEDIANATVYKTLRLDYENAFARLNDLVPKLESKENELNELKSERTSFKETLEAEFQKAMTSVQDQLTAAEKDLARVRGTRDDLHAQLQSRLSQESAQKASSEELKKISEANEARIRALEAEVERLKQSEAQIDVSSISEEQSTEEYKERIAKLQSQNQSFALEISAMEEAFKKAQRNNSEALAGTQRREAKFMKLQAEKVKADQKYFASMKAKDTLANEVKQMKVQVGSSREIISRFQDNEAASTKKASLLESRMASMQAASDKLKDDLIAMQTNLLKEKSSVKHFETQFNTTREVLEKEVAKVKEEKFARQILEQGTSSLQARYEELERQYKRLKGLKGSEDSTELVVYRQMAKCGVCNDNWRDQAITLCGHTFCHNCIDKRIQSRLRRCPICNIGFGANDLLTIHL